MLPKFSIDSSRRTIKKESSELKIEYSMTRRNAHCHRKEHPRLSQGRALGRNEHIQSGFGVIIKITAYADQIMEAIRKVYN